MKVVIIGYFTETSKKNVTGEFPKDWEICIVTPEEAEGYLSDADVVIPEHIQVNKEFLDKAPKLKLVQTGAGFDNVDIDECTKRGVWACNAAGVNAVAVAEHVMAFIFSWYKNTPYLDRFMKEHQDEKKLDYTGSELMGKTIGIIGLGAIGRNVAKYCNVMGMRVLGYDIRPVDVPNVEMVDLETIYTQSDIVTVHIFLNDQTRHMINRDVFAKMKKDAILINTARGPIVDEAQLVEALKNHDIGGACLDVFEKEPMTQDNPLRDLPNVILTPHTAGMPNGLKFHKTRYVFFLNNILKATSGQKPDSALNNLL